MTAYLLTRCEGTIGELARLLTDAAFDSGGEAINQRTLLLVSYLGPTKRRGCSSGSWCDAVVAAASPAWPGGGVVLRLGVVRAAARAGARDQSVADHGRPVRMLHAAVVALQLAAEGRIIARGVLGAVLQPTAQRRVYDGDSPSPLRSVGRDVAAVQEALVQARAEPNGGSCS